MHCDPASSKMAVYQQQFQESSSCLAHEVGCLNWSSLYTRISEKQVLVSVKEWTYQQEPGQVGKEQELPSSTSFIQTATGRCDPD